MNFNAELASSGVRNESFDKFFNLTARFCGFFLCWAANAVAPPAEKIWDTENVLILKKEWCVSPSVLIPVFPIFFLLFTKVHNNLEGSCLKKGSKPEL